VDVRCFLCNIDSPALDPWFIAYNIAASGRRFATDKMAPKKARSLQSSTRFRLAASIIGSWRERSANGADHASRRSGFMLALRRRSLRFSQWKANAKFRRSDFTGRIGDGCRDAGASNREQRPRESKTPIAAALKNLRGYFTPFV
jgi:hypothetical protein